MTGISNAVDLSLIIDGSISIKPYSIGVMWHLNSIQLWEYMGVDQHHKIKFGDETWCSPGNTDSLSFSGTTPKFAYQLKSLALGMYTQGISQGGKPLAWSTICHLISNLKRFGCLIASKYNISGIDELDSLEELKLRNIICEMIRSMKINKYPSVAIALLKAFRWTSGYNLITNSSVYNLMNEYLRPFSLLKNERRLKHSIIPPRILKILLLEAELQVEKAQKVFNLWENIQSRTNQEISTFSSKSLRNGTSIINVLTKEEEKELAKYHHTIKELRRYVYILILSYTGMRFSEVLSLPDNAAISRDGQYRLKTLLSKTTDGTQYLEWVTNKTTYDAVVLLSKINKIYRSRAELLLTYHYDFLSETRRINMQYGLSDKRLFNVLQHKYGCEFRCNSSVNDKGFANIKTLFFIPVTDDDIDLLNRMGCNYQSIAHNHKGFRQEYKKGILFNFTAHQFRHTFAWFIVANGLGDLDDIKYQFKHLESSMSLVYSLRGFESMEELINLTEGFSEFMVSQAVGDMVKASEDGVLAGRGGENFMSRMREILHDDLNSGSSPHFSNMQELLTFTAKHTSNFRGLSHGYCTKGKECKVRNVADPSHCVFCESYIATPKHLPHWLVIKQRCETQLQAFEKFPDDMKSRFMSFSTALTDNLNAANIIIKQLTVQVKEA